MPTGSWSSPERSSAIYVASPEGDTGKSTIALGILHRLAATVAKVGVFRPITRLGEDRDYILEAEDAKTYGLVDAIYHRRDDLALKAAG